MKWIPTRLQTRLFVSHVLVSVVGTLMLFVVTLLIAPTLHDQLMVALLDHDLALMHDPSMVEMERATNAVFQTAMFQALLISGSAASVVAVFVSLWLADRVVNPIRGLLYASQRIAAGHYTERVEPLRSVDELATLAHQFNRMAETLDAAEQRRVALIGDVAHELRTPLATIEGYAEGVLDRVVSPDDATWALILDESSRLRRLVHDLQELSRAEAKQLPLDLQLIAPQPLIEGAMRRLQPQFEEKRVQLRAELEPNLPLIYADPDRMTQVLINLLGNALQHTPPTGRVVLHAHADQAGLLIRIQDTGVGIAAEHLGHVFERFYRVDKARSRATGGSGIGLTICKALVEAHNGRIWIESPGVQQGTTVILRLPITQVG